METFEAAFRQLLPKAAKIGLSHGIRGDCQPSGGDRLGKRFKELQNTIAYRILYRMKVTALIPDELIDSVRGIAGSKNTTEALITALREWVSIKEMGKLRARIVKKPLKFSSQEVATEIRKLNRKS